MTDDLYLNVYLTNLGKYNEGELLGKWVEVTTDTDWKEELKSIGVADNTEYEEYFITDIESNFGLRVNEYTSLQELNEIAEKIEEINNENLQIEFQSILESLGYDSFEEAYNICIDGNYWYCDDVFTDEDLGQYSVDEGLFCEEIPDGLINYIDYEAIGRDIRLGNGGCFVANGYIETF